MRKCQHMIPFNQGKRVGPGWWGACWACGRALAYDAAQRRVVEYDQHPLWKGSSMNPRAMRIGQKYRIVHQTSMQRFPRVSVMTYLGEDYADRPKFNARPAASTQTLDWEVIQHVSPSSQANHSVNGRLG